jgi:hypothetical protein
MSPRGAWLLALSLLAGSACAQAPGAAAGPAPATPASREDGGGGIVYGKHFAFAVSAPAGWIFDNRSGVHQGLHAVAYRQGETYSAAKSLMYANGSTPKGEGPVSLDAFIADDLAQFRAASPGIETFAIDSVPLQHGPPARVVGFRGDRYGNVEAVAYIPMGDSVAMLVLTARSQQRFDADLADFRAFVGSFLAMDRAEEGATAAPTR